MKDHLVYGHHVLSARGSGTPLVALESTVIAHGLPWPENLEIARKCEEAVRHAGAVPATIGIVDGRLTIGLSDEEMTFFAQSNDIEKVSRRDIAAVAATGGNGATTVAGTMILAAMAGIRCFATGGIGGVHRGAEVSFDVSADLRELSRTPVLVVSSGAKSILDIPKTLEYLETEGVPVLGNGTDEFPAFHARESGLKLDRACTGPKEIAAIARIHWHLDETVPMGGILIGNPVPADKAVVSAEMTRWVESAIAAAERDGITGKAVTPYLLSALAMESDGKSLEANKALLIDNARVAGEIACALGDLEKAST